MDETQRGVRLRTLREARGWTIRELARRARVSHTQISQMEAGKSGEPHELTKKALTEAFGWQVWEEMLAGTALEPPANRTVVALPVDAAEREIVTKWLVRQLQALITHDNVNPRTTAAPAPPPAFDVAYATP